MNPIRLGDLSVADRDRILARSSGTGSSIESVVTNILALIKKSGDKEIINTYQKRYGQKTPTSIQVTRQEINRAYRTVSPPVLKAIEQAAQHITAVCNAQLQKRRESSVKPGRGIRVWRLWRAIEKVGLYIPGGRAIYPSSVLMTGIPARIAGCRQIILCSPPGDDGQIPAPTLAAAESIGIKKIYKVGGAQAIAAMAYGTQTIPAVYKIFGAGNSYITTAKMLIQGPIAIDMPAGPSEVLILADETANPAFIAADLLADGEHGDDSACVLVTTSATLAKRTVEQIQKQLPALSTAGRVSESLKRYGLIAVADSLDEAIAFINDYAPEHLEIMVKNPESLINKIENAGSVFIGDWTTKSAGDYATGANHVLPTGGMAKMYPPLGVDSFGKWMQVQRCTKEGLASIQKTIETLAIAEGLPAHKNSSAVRFNEYDR